MWIVAINEKYPITDQGALNELNRHQTPRVKSKVNISLCRRKSYQRTGLEYIRSRFDQVRYVVSHIEVHLPEKKITPKNIGEGLKVPHRQSWKDFLSVQYDKKTISALFFLPYQSNPSLK